MKDVDYMPPPTCHRRHQVLIQVGQLGIRPGLRGGWQAGGAGRGRSARGWALGL